MAPIFAVRDYVLKMFAEPKYCRRLRTWSLILTNISGTFLNVHKMFENKHHVGCEAPSAGLKKLKMPTLWRVILTRKVRQTNLAFCVPRWFISMALHANVQVSLCSGYGLCHSG